MKLTDLLVASLSILLLSACSSGKSDGKKSVPVNDFVASDKMLGKFSSDQDLTEHSPEAVKQLQEWGAECSKAEKFSPEARLKVGLKVISRSDEISLWPNLTPEGQVRNYEQTVETIVSPSEFISMTDQIGQSHSLRGRKRHQIREGGYYSELIEIVSTNPPELKQIIEEQMKDSDSSVDDDQHSLRCKQEKFENSKNNVSYATMTLKDGTQINGILETLSYEGTNFSCGLYRKDESLVREVKLADRVLEERINFYSKEFINPFEGGCRSSSLYSVDSIKDISGTRGVLRLYKDEVLSIKE